MNAQRINAMVSVHAHAESRKLSLPRQLHIMKLHDAVTFLEKDSRRDFFGKARIHRAIAKLAAYDPVLFRPALLILAGPDLLKNLEKAIAGETPEQRETSANDELIRVDGSPFKNCNPKTLTYNVDPTNPMTISSTVSVQPSSFATLERALDPQNWDVCSKFWNPPERTYLATRVGGTVTSNPPYPSDSYYQHELYEHFNSVACSTFLGFATCHEADFQNMLDITSTPGSQRYRTDYTFVKPPILGTMDGVAVTIKIDDGYLSATPDGTGLWTIEGKKYLQFEEVVANQWALTAFGYGLKELAAEVSDIACCDVSVVSAALAAPTLTSVDSVP